MRKLEEKMALQRKP